MNLFLSVSDRDKNLYVYMYLPEGKSQFNTHICDVTQYQMHPVT